MSTNKKLNIGIIASSNGGVFKEIFKLNKYADFFVITDRKCGIEKFCQKHKIPNIRIEEPNNDVFSKKAHQFFKNKNLNFILLFYLRLVGKSIYNNYPTYNIHPSLLPEFKGFNPIKQAIKEKTKKIGATLHLVNESIDNGPIIVKTSIPIFSYDENHLNHISFYQKTLLAYLIIDKYFSGSSEVNMHFHNKKIESQLNRIKIENHIIYR